MSGIANQKFGTAMPELEAHQADVSEAGCGATQHAGADRESTVVNSIAMTANGTVTSRRSRRSARPQASRSFVTQAGIRRAACRDQSR